MLGGNPMSVGNIAELKAEFESAMIIEQNTQCWNARRLAALLEYPNWDAFLKVVEKAKDACRNSGGDPNYHFKDVTYFRGFAGAHEEDILMSRWGAYLVAMNGHPKKERVAFAQLYFVGMTLQAEAVEQRMLLHDRLAARKELAMSESDFNKAMIEAGLDGPAVGRVRNAGDESLFRMSTESVKRMYGMVDADGNPTKQPLADRAPTLIQRAKAFASELTKKRIHSGTRGELSITAAHKKHNADVREVIEKAGHKPEDLPPEEDTKLLEKRLKKEQKVAQKLLEANKQLLLPMPKLQPTEAQPEVGYTPGLFDTDADGGKSSKT